MHVLSSQQCKQLTCVFLTGSKWTYLLDLQLCSEHELVMYTAHCYHWLEVSQLQVVFGVLPQHTSAQVRPGRREVVYSILIYHWMLSFCS